MTSFVNQVPPNWKLPLVHIQIDGSQAGSATGKKIALIIGYMLTGLASPNVQIAVGSAANAAALFGLGSPIERSISRFFSINPAQIIYAAGITPPSSGVAATGNLTVSSAPTVAGTYPLYIAGQKLSIGVGGSDTAATVATNIAAAVNALTSLPVTAAVDGSVASKVNLTSRFKGILGNDTLISDSYLGLNGGEQMPTSMAVTYTAMSGGTGTPDLSAMIANMGDEPYEYVASPFTDTGAIGALDTEYGFGATGRWGWMRQLYGEVFGARRDTYSGHMTWGATQNSAVTSVMAVEPTSPSPVWEWVGAYTAQASAALTADPARPLQTLTLDGILPAPKSDRFNSTELNALAQSGLAIQSCQGTDVPQILREQTLYQKNSYGQPDVAYELVTTLATNAELFRRMINAITTKYPRHKLADDGTPFGPGQAIVTPKLIKAELVSEYRQAEYDGLVENGDAFVANLIVVRNSDDPTRLDVLYPPDLINGFRQFAVLGQFRLQYATQQQAA